MYGRVGVLITYNILFKAMSYMTPKGAGVSLPKHKSMLDGLFRKLDVHKACISTEEMRLQLFCISTNDEIIHVLCQRGPGL